MSSPKAADGGAAESRSPAYATYWRRKQLLAGPVPHFPVKKWWATEGLCEIEEIMYDAVRQSRSLLEFGAGEMRVERKLKVAGYAGEYHTLDTSSQGEYTYGRIEEVNRCYEAILCLDVIEHLPLNDALELINALVAKLSPGGTLAIQTPNARCVSNPMAWDMTHLHCYSITDLWAYLSALDLRVVGYRVCMVPQRPTLSDELRHQMKRLATTRVLGCDFADNIVVIARKP